MVHELNKTDAQKREHPDPHESSVPIPRTVIAIVSLLLIWAVAYIFMARPNDPPALGDRRTEADLMARAGGPGSAGGAVDGAQIFAAQCAACHQANGQGVPGVFPPLAGSEWVTAKPELIIDILLHGVTGKLTVKGNAYNGAMPAFGDKLSDAELAAVLSHIRTGFGNSAENIDAAAVKAQREASASRTTPWNGDDDLASRK
jgi:mono/diheme cytochrome c family protein